MSAMILPPNPRRFGLVLMILLGMMRAGTTSAATYYIDYADGDNTAAGTTTAAPWKHSPGDSAATGTPATTTLAPGDVVNFKGGVAYLLATNSGGIYPVSGVTYDGAAWGTGKAIVTDSNAPGGHSAFGLYYSQSNVVIRSFMVTNLGGALNLPADTGTQLSPSPGIGVNISGGAHHILISDCDFARLGYWQNAKPSGSSAINGAGVSISGGGKPNHSIMVTNCTFKRMRTGVQMYANPSLTNITVANCAFSEYFVWCMDIGVTTANTYMDFISVHDCTFFDYYQYTTWAGYPDGDGPHLDGIFFRNDYGGTTYGSHNVLYNNLFYSTSGTGGGTAQIYVTDGASLSIFGNIFIMSGMSCGNIYLNGGKQAGVPTDTTSQVVNIFNNTFFDNYTLNVYVTPEFYGGTQTGTAPGKIRLENNIFYDTSTSSASILFNLLPGTYDWAARMANWFVDYNLYYTRNTYYATYVPGAGGGYYNGGPWTLAQAQTYMGWEKYSRIADPLFVNISLPTPNQNFRLQTNSPCIGAGTNLTAAFSWLPGLTIDRNGQQRPATGGWDMGAYQFTGTKPPPTAPQLLPVKPKP